MIQVVLTKPQLNLIGDLRSAHVKIGALLALHKKGSMEKEEALKRIEEAFCEAEKSWEVLTKEGL